MDKKKSEQKNKTTYEKPINLSGGTNFSYIQYNGENIRVRTDQLWFWSDEWQTRHEEAIADLNEGRYTVYETGSDFLAAMDEAIARNEAKARNGR